MLELEGLDDEKPGRATLKVLINGQAVFEGTNTFGEKDWTWAKILVPGKLLRKGSNTIELINTTPDKTAAVAQIYGGHDYLWGWMLIADVRLVFAEGAVPASGPTTSSATR